MVDMSRQVAEVEIFIHVGHTRYQVDHLDHLAPHLSAVGSDFVQHLHRTDPTDLHRTDPTQEDVIYHVDCMPSRELDHITAVEIRNLCSLQYLLYVKWDPIMS